jgi:hypothetical protein
MPTTIKGVPGIFLRRHEASQYLLDDWGLSYTVNTLAVMAGERRGPPYHLLGNRALYPIDPAFSTPRQRTTTAPTTLRRRLRAKERPEVHASGQN